LVVILWWSDGELWWVGGRNLELKNVPLFRDLFLGGCGSFDVVRVDGFFGGGIMVRPSTGCDKGFANLQIGAQLLLR
jgi:hypothetical protein